MKINGIKQYLKVTDHWIRTSGQPFTLDGFVLKYGRGFKWRRSLGAYDFLRGEIRQCYLNAANAAISHPELTYCEGYASSLIPVNHAWCLDPQGRVLELTWEEPGSEYYGIPFKTEFLRRQLLTQKYYGLIDAWQSNWPLLRGKYPKKDWYKKV